MASGILVENNVNFRGVWCVGQHLSERQIKSIFAEYSSKPSRSCKLRLTSSGLVLETLPTGDGKSGGKMNEIVFQDIQDLLYSQQDLLCLLVIYVDPKRTLSVLACSSEKSEDVMAIHKAFLGEKYRRQQNGHVKRTQHQTIVLNGAALANHATHARLAQRPSLTPSGQGSSYRNYSDSDMGDENVFLNDEGFLERREEIKVEREPIDLNNDGHPEAYHVGVQTYHVDELDTASLVSESSMQTLKDDYQALSDEMKALKILLEKTTGISAEEYYRRGDLPQPRNRKTVAFQPAPSHISNHTSGAQENGASGAVIDESYAVTHGHVVGADDYDRRSISVQTNKSRLEQKIRYAKNPLTPSVSQAYKEKMAALRKRGGVTGSESSSAISVDVQMSSLGSSTSSSRSIVKIPQGKPIARSMSTGRTTVNRPIEQVYHNRTGSQKKKRIIFAPNNQPL